MTKIDFTIVGGGLAGMMLAWQLHWRGVSFRIVDRDDTVTASKVAAGLINPITGKRLAVMPRWTELLPAAVAFYKRVEAETGSQFFHPTGMVRILKDDFEQQRYAKRAGHHFETLVQVTQPELTSDFEAPLGTFALPAAARLDVNAFLAAARSAFSNQIEHRNFSHGDVDANRITIFCTGIAAMTDLHVTGFQPAKGELLTVRVPGLTEARIVNHGVWLMPLGNELFRVGATYSWDALDAIPTDNAKSELTRKLQVFLKRPFEIVEHHAATRPILTDRLPMLGAISEGVFVFNGLGSKGALLAPFYSQQLAEHMLNGCAIDANVDVERFHK